MAVWKSAKSSSRTRIESRDTSAEEDRKDGRDEPVPPIDIERMEAPVTAKGHMMCAFAAFAGMLFGYDSGYISSVVAMPQFRINYGHPVPVSENAPEGYTYYAWEQSLIVSILSAGTFFGAIISGSLADRFGRRVTIIAGCAVFIIGVVVQVAYASIATLAVGRLIAGFGVGFVSAIVVLYMSEVAPRKVRGAIVSCYQFAITIGIMLASCVGYGTKGYTTPAAFRIPIAIQIIWALILAAGLFLLPESPRYYVKKGRSDRAIKSLSRLRGRPTTDDLLQDELAEIMAHWEYEKQVGEVGWLGCFSGGITNRSSNLRKIFIGTTLQMMQQATGINFIFYYNNTFFTSVGLTNPFLIATITTVVNVCSTPVSFYIIERYGRRPLLIYGAVAMAVCEFVIAAVWTVDQTAKAANYTLIVFVCLYVFFFASTWGPAAWVVIGEIFQLPIRAKGVSLSTASNWFWNCVIAVVVPYMVDPGYGNLGGKVFFIWGTTCAISALFAFFFVPETKFLTLEQVDKMMEEVNPINSSKWRMHDTFMHELGGGWERRPFSVAIAPDQKVSPDGKEGLHEPPSAPERRGWHDRPRDGSQTSGYGSDNGLGNRF